MSWWSRGRRRVRHRTTGTDGGTPGTTDSCPPDLGANGPCYRDAPDFYFRQVEDLRPANAASQGGDAAAVEHGPQVVFVLRHPTERRVGGQTGHGPRIGQGDDGRAAGHGLVRREAERLGADRQDQGDVDGKVAHGVDHRRAVLAVWRDGNRRPGTRLRRAAAQMQEGVAAVALEIAGQGFEDGPALVVGGEAQEGKFQRPGAHRRGDAGGNQRRMRMRLGGGAIRRPVAPQVELRLRGAQARARGVWMRVLIVLGARAVGRRSSSVCAGGIWLRMLSAVA